MTVEGFTAGLFDEGSEYLTWRAQRGREMSWNQPWLRGACASITSTTPESVALIAHPSLKSFLSLMGRLMRRYGFVELLKNLAGKEFPIYGTCAGLILMVRSAVNSGQPLLGLMDIGVRSNVFGRQLDSFEQNLIIPEVGSRPFRGIFIRTPKIEQLGKGVRVLSEADRGMVVVAEQGNLLVYSFNPELTGDLRIHRYFMEKIIRSG